MAQNPNLSGNFGNTGVGQDLVPVTPNDSADLAVTARALRVPGNGTAGTLRFTAWNGQVRNTYIGAGETLMVAALRVHATGTSATPIEAYV